MESEIPIARLTLQDLLEEAGQCDPRDILIEIEDFATSPTVRKAASARMKSSDTIVIA